MKITYKSAWIRRVVMWQSNYILIAWIRLNAYIAIDYDAIKTTVFRLNYDLKSPCYTHCVYHDILEKCNTGSA